MKKAFCSLLFLLLLLQKGFANGTSFENDTLDTKLSGNYRVDTSRVQLILKLSTDFLKKSSELSMRYAYQALEMSTQMEYEPGMATAERIIGADYSSQANFAEGLKHLMRAMELTEQAGDTKEKAKVLNDLGLFNMTLKQFTKAIDFYKQASELSLKNGFHSFHSVVISNMAEAYQKSGNDQKAEEIATQGLAQAKVDNNKLLQANNLRTLGDIMSSRRQFDQARTLYLKAFPLYTAVRDDESKLIILANLGTTYLESEDPGHAQVYYQQVLASSQKMGYSYMLMNSYQKLSAVDSMTGNFTLALAHYKKYVQIKDSTESLEKLIQISKLNAHRALEFKQQSIEQLIIERNSQAATIKYKNVIVLIFSLLLPIIMILAIILGINFLRKKNINIQLSRQKEELQTLNTVKDKLFSIISHDLRSPLANLEAILKLMDNGDLTNDEVIMLSGQLTQNVQETSSMLDNLLQWSKSQMKGILPKSERVNLAILADEVASFFAAQAEKKAITLQTLISPPHTVLADKEMIRLVMRNLVANAIKFTPTGGKICISVHGEKKSVDVSVSDSGIGISAKNIDKLFSPDAVTTRGTQNEKGTGLGLILCKDFVDINKGKISVTSTQGKGSAFTFSLPLLVESTDSTSKIEKPKYI